MNNSHHEIDEEIRRIRSARRDCPSPEELAGHLDGELSGEDSRLLELHLHNCPSCAMVLERLAESEEVSGLSVAYRRRQVKEVDDVARRLGFERSAGRAGPIKMLDWLWQVNVPLYVPLAAGIALLMLVVYAGRVTTEPPIELLGTARFIGFEQSVSRSAGEDGAVERLQVGEVVIIDYRLDDPEFLPGDNVHCVVTDGQGQPEVLDAVIGPDLSLLLPLRFSEPGMYFLQLHRKRGDPPFGTCKLDVRNVPQNP